MKILIVDDELRAREAIRKILEHQYPHFKEIHEAVDVPDAVKAINKLKPNLVFLDIEMPGYSGLEIFEFFDPENIHFHVVFVTAYAEFAIQAFRLSAVDYLLKPIRVDQLSQAVDKVAKIIGEQTDSDKPALKALKENLKPGSTPKLLLNVTDGILMVPISDIIYLKAEGSYTAIFLSDGSKHVISKVLAEYDYLTEFHSFFRNHRSYIVNLEKLRKINKNDNLLLLEGDFEIPVTQERKAQLLELLKNNI